VVEGESLDASATRQQEGEGGGVVAAHDDGEEGGLGGLGGSVSQPGAEGGQGQAQGRGEGGAGVEGSAVSESESANLVAKPGGVKARGAPGESERVAEGGEIVGHERGLRGAEARLAESLPSDPSLSEPHREDVHPEHPSS
jgi:hypothetical protein